MRSKMALGCRFPCLLLLFVVLPCFSNALPRFLHGRPKGGRLGAPAHPIGAVLPADQWLTQRLDHFNDADTTTWIQRYYVNDTFYRPGGPVFLMIGGEGTASPTWMVTGAWIKYAQKFKALCFQLEHRFYGKSHPTPNMSSANLRFLSSEQALADLANFRVQMGEKYSVSHAKWIAFGGSYPGSLAAWFRLKYPHLVHGSVATSGPLFAKINFVEYLDVVRQSLDTAGNKCNENIANATQTIESMIQTDTGRAELYKYFKLCQKLDPTNTNDIANFYSSLAGNFENVVQYNKDNRAFEGGVGANITIDTLCGIMADQSQGSPLMRYAAVNNLILNTYSEPCLDFSYAGMIKELQQTSWNSSAGEGGRQWIYQTCVEFGFYQSSDLPNQPFGHMFPVKFSTQQCAEIYGSAYVEQVIKNGILRTNTNYGALAIRVTRVVFPNGSIDPWHALGVTTDLSPEATAIFINGTAHCANMYPESPDDPPQLAAARVQIEKLIAQWLMEE